MTKTIAFALALFPLLCWTARADDAAQPDAKTELQDAIDILKAHHMNSAKMDWPTITAEANKMIAGAKTAADAYPAIRYLVQQTGEKHTAFVAADLWKATVSGKQVGDAKPMDWTPPEGHLLAGGIGLISIKGYQGAPADDITYTHAAREAVHRFAAAHVCRFIVDLRGNHGGNMYPMIDGVAALLGAEPYGYWQTTGETKDEAWTNTSGRYTSDNDAPLASRTIALLAKAPVAVLIDRVTVSAGEFTAMAFEGRPNTRFFGEPSAGYLTINQMYPLPDGAQLVVSEGWATDRLHRDYRQRIVPDEQTDRSQATLDAAIAWLKRQPCRG